MTTRNICKMEAPVKLSLAQQFEQEQKQLIV